MVAKAYSFSCSLLLSLVGDGLLSATTSSNSLGTNENIPSQVQLTLNRRWYSINIRHTRKLQFFGWISTKQSQSTSGEVIFQLRWTRVALVVGLWVWCMWNIGSMFAYWRNGLGDMLLTLCNNSMFGASMQGHICPSLCFNVLLIRVCKIPL